MKIADASPSPAAAEDVAFVSTLDDGPQRFLARALHHGLKYGRRSAADFVRHFPPSAIMRGLEHNAELRGHILAQTTGIKEKIAQKKPWEDAAADLKLAFDEGETNAEAIVELMPADQCVRHLEARKLWHFLCEGDFWNSEHAGAAAKVARDHVSYLLDSALEEELIDQRDIVEAITVTELANRLPREHLGVVLRCALDNGKNSRTFTAFDFLASAGTRILVQHVPLSHIWNTVVKPRIARRHGYEGTQELASRSVAPSESADPSSEPPQAERILSHQDDPDEITRVLPGTTIAAALKGVVAPMKPAREAPPKTAPRATGGQRPEDLFADDEIDAAIVQLDDAAKTG